MTARYLPAEERRSVTVETVLALAAEQNPSEITTAAIAERMHLTQGALFRHFPSKEALWTAVMEWVAERLMQRIERAVADAPGPLAALRSMFLAHAGFVVEHPGVPRMMFGELQRAEASAPKRMAQALIRRYGERVRALLAAGQAAGEVAADIDLDAATTLFIGTIQGLVMQSLLAGEPERISREAPAVLALYLRAIRSHP
ncbi:TetR/AcrR family transcriptional regulator [Thauera sp.]|jgi:AcrR family transcriptional regulator|uniref:TetR/AcrR family transcriptional regulator n=1 Tax=Thauera sp. TaxID=1905334 RepID=UPI002A35CF0A|nr:TetR family transcriptional regulator [Thauera sp.]MDX9886956.1 TetR family transcriptional regulator [Thauera sp.]